MEQQEEKLLDELWEADGRAKEEQEVQRVRRQQERNKLHLDFIRSQMEAAEQRRRQHKDLREEEAELMVCTPKHTRKHKQLLMSLMFRAPAVPTIFNLP